MNIWLLANTSAASNPGSFALYVIFCWYVAPLVAGALWKNEGTSVIGFIGFACWTVFALTRPAELIFFWVWVPAALVALPVLWVGGAVFGKRDD